MAEQPKQQQQQQQQQPKQLGPAAIADLIAGETKWGSMRKKGIVGTGGGSPYSGGRESSKGGALGLDDLTFLLGLGDSGFTSRALIDKENLLRLTGLIPNQPSAPQRAPSFSMGGTQRSRVSGRVSGMSGGRTAPGKNYWRQDYEAERARKQKLLDAELDRKIQERLMQSKIDQIRKSLGGNLKDTSTTEQQQLVNIAGSYEPRTLKTTTTRDRMAEYLMGLLG